MNAPGRCLTFTVGKQGCLPHAWNLEIRSWNARRILLRYTNASASLKKSCSRKKVTVREKEYLKTRGQIWRLCKSLLPTWNPLGHAVLYKLWKPHSFPYLSHGAKTQAVFTSDDSSLVLLFNSPICSVWELNKTSQFLIPFFFSVRVSGWWGIVWDVPNHSSTLTFQHLKIIPTEHLTNISSFPKILPFNPPRSSQKTSIFGAS